MDRRRDRVALRIPRIRQHGGAVRQRQYLTLNLGECPLIECEGWVLKRGERLRRDGGLGNR